jgi:hypothetical protein
VVAEVGENNIFISVNGSNYNKPCRHLTIEYPHIA